jgi:sec-independent protein translocase protein TatC
MSADPAESTMTFWEHLEELRKRLVRATLAYVLGAGVAWYFREPILLWVTAPFTEAWSTSHIPGAPALHFAAPAALFMAYLKLSLLGGLVLSLPFILYQLWAFVAPGLYARERRYGLLFVVSSCVLFVCGSLFGFRFAFAPAFEYFLSFAGPVGGAAFQVTPTVMVDDYMSFVIQMLVAFGLIFELPVLVFFLSIAGIIDHKFLIGYWRHFVVVAFIVGAIFSPPDVMSQCMLALPMLVLYLVSIGIAFFFAKKRQVPEPSGDAA